MINKINLRALLKVCLLFFILTFFNQCGIWDPADARKVPVNAKDRVAKNIEEGRSIKFGKLGQGGSGTFDFASSNEMWRATIEILNFVPLTSADYGGGIVITDWYNEESNLNDSIKISIRFLSNEIRADALKITVFSKECQKNINCKVSQSNPKIVSELKVAILKRAAQYKKDIVDSNPKRDIYTILTPDDR